MSKPEHASQASHQLTVEPPMTTDCDRCGFVTSQRRLYSPITKTINTLVEGDSSCKREPN